VAMSVKVCRRVFVDDVPLHGMLSVENDVETAWTDLAEPDPRWTFVDSAGHFHARNAEGELPTLVSRPEHVDCDGSCGGQCGGEGYTAVHWHCAICGEEAVPGTVPGPHEVVVARRRSWSVLVEGGPVFAVERVSVRLEFYGKPTMFGVARVGSSSGRAGGVADTQLLGEGALSVMAEPPAGLVRS
jgi:hypothetical protein